MIRNIVLTCFLIAFSASSASAQFLIFWNEAEGDWNTSANWFEEFGPPDAEIGDVAVVSNKGLAFLDSAAPTDAGGVILGERAGESGILHIRSGGELTVIDDLDVKGDVRVGQSGLGTLIVDRGGSLTAESLRSGGHIDSGLVLGGGTSGNASVTINGPAVLTRNSRIIGSNVAFEAETLNLAGVFTSEIHGEQHSTLDINEVATLGGTLNLQFDSSFQPSLANTWNLIDADSINGNFSNITSNVSPGPGLSFTVNKVEGGKNGMLAQLGVDARLQLTIDRRSGASQIQNFAEGQSLTINGYGVASGSGLLNDANWSQLEGPWSGNSSNTHVSQISLTDSHVVGAGGTIDLGNVYSFEPAELGDSNEDVIFEYHVDGGEVVQGLVDFTGPHHDVVLVVGDDGAYIQNQSTKDVTINGYAIISRSGALDPAGWTSLADGDNAWTEANAASNHVTELNLNGALTLPATGNAIPLGAIISAGANDLEFVVNMADSGPHAATVEYEDGVIDFGAALVGDCNGDGSLTAADLTCVADIAQRDAVLSALNTLPGDLDGNGDVAFADFLTLSANFSSEGGYHQGNIDLAGDIGFPDFLVMSSNFGQSPQAAAVPEPSCLGWTLLGLVFIRRRRR